MLLVVGACALAGIVFLFLHWQGNDDLRAQEDAQHAASPLPFPAFGEPPVVLTPIAASASAQSTHKTNSVKLFSAASLYGVFPYDFSMLIPAVWKVEAIPRSESINIFDPSASGTRALELSQVFIRYFSGRTFLTLPSVRIISRTERTVAGRSAVEYVVEKKSGYPDFPNQPAWRNLRHTVVDIRATDAAQSVFYVFAKNPELPYDVFTSMLETIVVSPKDLLFHPIDDFFSGVAKKPFGVFVNPENSPVFPERFTGYHTGADVEMPDGASATSAMQVFAVADGTVVKSGSAKGYGGIIAIRHALRGETFVAVYGHLNPESLVPQGRKVKAGQIIGYLGKTFSPETDNERRHLHFGIHKGDVINIAGYVSQQLELGQWHDPVKFFEEYAR